MHRHKALQLVTNLLKHFSRARCHDRDARRVIEMVDLGHRQAFNIVAASGKEANDTRQDTGFPTEQAWWTVKRQCMIVDDATPTGLYLATTNGEVWASSDEGDTYTCIARHLPHVYALSVGRPA